MHRHRSDFPFTSFAAAAAASPPVVFRLSAGLVQHASLGGAWGCLERADSGGGRLEGYGGEIGACTDGGGGVGAPRIPQTRLRPARWARCPEVSAANERLPGKSTQRARHEMMGARVDRPARPDETRRPCSE